MKSKWNMTEVNDSCHPGPAMRPFRAHIPAWRQTPEFLSSAQVEVGASAPCATDHSAVMIDNF